MVATAMGCDAAEQDWGWRIEALAGVFDSELTDGHAALLHPWKRMYERRVRIAIVLVLSLALCSGLCVAAEVWPLALVSVVAFYSFAWWWMRRFKAEFRRGMCEHLELTDSQLSWLFEYLNSCFEEEFRARVPLAGSEPRRLLAATIWCLCEDETREEQIEPALADIRRQQLQMERDGCRPARVTAFLNWQMVSLAGCVAVDRIRCICSQTVQWFERRRRQGRWF